MLFKLAASSVRYRWKDYLLLFSGLAISSAIFYLFETIAANHHFLMTNGQTVSSMIGYVFGFGAVLLGLLTLIYLNYANSFLLSMRQRDYGLFMMLGTRKKRIGQLIWLETMVLGSMATLLGIVLGIGLSFGLSSLVIKFLGTAATAYHPLWLSAIIWTLLIYLGLFLLAATWNTVVMTKKPVLQLLKANQQSSFHQSKPLTLLIELIAGVLLLVVGYYVMLKPLVFHQYTILIAVLTLTFGTYFLFKAVVSTLLQWLEHFSFAKRGLNGFTLAQLRFRIADYTKVLTGITMMFAMALGAITVGMGLNKMIDTTSRVSGAYDLSIIEPTSQQQKLIKQLSLQQKRTYTFVKENKKLVFAADQFKAQPFWQVKIGEKVGRQLADAKLQVIPAQKTDLLASELSNYLGVSRQKNGQINQIKVQTDLSQVTGSTEKVVFLRTKNIQQSALILRKLARLEKQKHPVAMNNPSLWLGDWDSYRQVRVLYSGLEFMAVLLGISFLAMLASCLMFKILSGSFADIPRYELLRKLGTHQSSLRWSIRREIAILFCLPAVLGVVHVLFGLNLFASLLADPYKSLWLPFIIFGLIYLGYYLFLNFVYQRIVLKKSDQ
jgi:putative ABC transport system permease protein